jgi:hypothetical protein
MKKTGIVLGMAFLVGALSAVRGADLKLDVADKQPPAEVGDAIKKVLESRALQIVDDDKPVYQFWFRKDTPVKSKPDAGPKALDAMADVTLFGVATVGSGQRDYKDSEIPPGTYTMRYSLQPQDGDHLGTSDYLYFAVLVPAKNDTELEGIKTYKAMVRASSKGSPAGHPLVLSLRPASGSGDSPTLTTPAPEHKAVTVKITAQPKGADAAVTLPFDLVYEGRYKH